MSLQCATTFNPSSDAEFDLLEVINEIEMDSEAAHFRYSVKSEWTPVGLNRTSVRGCYEPGSQTKSERFDNPAEFIFHALASCMTTTLIRRARARNVAVQEVKCELIGEIDLCGLLGIQTNGRHGSERAHIYLNARCATDADELKVLALESTVYRAVTRHLPVDVTVETY